MRAYNVDSPISKMYNTQEVESLLSAVRIIGPVDQQLLSTAFNLPHLPDWIAEKLGIDRGLMRTSDEREALEEQAKNMASQMSGVNNLLELNSGVTR